MSKKQISSAIHGYVLAGVQQQDHPEAPPLHAGETSFSIHLSTKALHLIQHLEEKSKKEGKRLLEGSVGAVGVASRGEKQPVEIIGVEDITRQIAVQMEGGGERAEIEGGRGMRDTVIEVGNQSCIRYFVFL